MLTSFSSVDLERLLQQARAASHSLANAPRNHALQAIAEALEQRSTDILSANAQDVAQERSKGTAAALVDRLSLSTQRLQAIAEAVRSIAALPDPLGRVLAGWRLENGLDIRKVSVPFGVIGMIYESRPNVTVDAAALALKAGSSAVLRGSANALHSNRILVEVMQQALQDSGVDPCAVQLIDSPERELVTALLQARGQVDVIIPRGGASLIQHVVHNAKVPVIETGVGNCHIYVDAAADLDKAQAIVLNAKTQRPGVCNAAETLLVHRAVADTFIPEALRALQDANVRLRACPASRALYPEAETADESDWETEYLDYCLAVRVVDSLDEAIAHISRYGSQHSEAIISEDRQSTKRFCDAVDAAAVYVNASTRFTDGFVFGFGAEIGISTQKLHARGPMGLAEITTHKYIIEGDGQTRN